MKSINAKRIAALVTGVALLGVGIACAAPVSIQNVPIINTAGQPVVQIVLGSNAKISDGIAAGNIAAAIGNLAYTSQPVTATVNQSSLANLKVSYSSPTYSLTNQQVWLNESGITSASGSSYLFSALIGSVLNQGIVLGSPASTKALKGGTSSYAFSRTNSTTSSPAPSPYSVSGYVPNSGFSNQQGGGVSFDSFTNMSGNQDNILQISNAQFSALKNNWGSAGETEYLWLTGSPVFDAESGVNSYALRSAGGAYQVVFNNEIQNRTSNNGTIINTPVSILGQNYTIIKGVGTSGASSGTYKAGGSIQLASSITPMQTVYVGKNLTSGPWTIQLQDLAQTNNGTNDAAAVSIYYNGVNTNETSLSTRTTTKFNVSGHTLFVDLNSTFAGLYAYQKWAKIQLYTNVYNLTNGQQFNSTRDPGWYTNLLWTNTSSGNKDNALYSIILRNSSPTNLLPGQSFSFMQNPTAYKLTFTGDTMGSNYDQIQINSQSATNGAYQNIGKGVSGTSVTNITEPEQILQVQSNINNAFSFAGQTSGTVDYLLNPYSLVASPSLTATNGGTNVILTYTNPAGIHGGSNNQWINSSQPLQLYVEGYNTTTGSIIQEYTQLSSTTTSGNTIRGTVQLSRQLQNVTAIQIEGNKVLPIGADGALTINVINGYTGTAGSGTVIGSLQSQPAGVIYSLSGISDYQGFTANPTVIYNQWKGQPTTTLSLVPVTANTASAGGSQEYFKFQINEYPVPSSTTYPDSLGIGLFNATSSPIAQAQTIYILNYSESGTRNNVTYIPTTGTGNTLQVQSSFRTEKGSKIDSITPQHVSFDMATGIDQLQFALTQGTSNAIINKSYVTYGPYGIGQMTNLPNMSIANINAAITYSSNSTTPTITGESSLTAVPSILTASTPTLLTNLGTTSPLVVSDLNADPSMNLILVGSGYVNSLSQALQQSYNVSITANGSVISGQAYGDNRILVAGYSAAQTQAAASSFIEQLYAAAASNT